MSRRLGSAESAVPICSACVHYQASDLSVAFDRCLRVAGEIDPVRGLAVARFCQIERGSIDPAACGGSGFFFVASAEVDRKVRKGGK